MMLQISDIVCLPGVPATNRGVRYWLKARKIPVNIERNRFWFRLSDLPEDVRSAYELRQIEAAGLDGGEFDAGAHDLFAAATPHMRKVALHKAEIARFLLKAGVRKGRGVTRAVEAQAQATFGKDLTNRQALRRISLAVEGVDPVNFAPALLHDYARTGSPAAEISEEAWSYFMTTLRDAGPEFPLVQAWRDVRDLAAHRGWNWPPYVTVWRRWDTLPEAQKLHARHGREAAVKALAMPVKRAKTSITPLEWVSLDGRMLDFWVDFGDGKPVRPLMVALIDSATNFVLGYELDRSENAVAVGRVIRKVCMEHGIFDRLYPDNGSAFASHYVAGGAKHKWRGKGKAEGDVVPLGVCHHLGIEMTFAIPKNAQAKAAERTFATISRTIDDRPEFKGAHAGHSPGAAPDDRVAPVPFDVATRVIQREIERHNVEEGRKGQGARGRSYAQMFRDGLAGRIVRRPTSQQLYWASLIYTAASVDRVGRVHVGTWSYGGPETQAALLPWHKQGQILVGRDPDNFEAPAVAFDSEGYLICKGIEPVKAGAYDSVDGAREAAKNRKAARQAVAAAEVANTYLTDADMAAALIALDALDTPKGTEPEYPAKVVGARFGGTLRPARKAVERPKAAKVPEEFLRNMDAALAAKLAGGEKLA